MCWAPQPQTQPGTRPSPCPLRKRRGHVAPLRHLRVCYLGVSDSGHCWQAGVAGFTLTRVCVLTCVCSRVRVDVVLGPCAHRDLTAPTLICSCESSGTETGLCKFPSSSLRRRLGKDCYVERNANPDTVVKSR